MSTRTSMAPTAEMMTAVTQHRYGKSGMLHLSTVERPVPRADEVLLKVGAAGVSRGVWHMMTGLPYLVRLFGGLRRPRQSIPGMDVCGEVVRIGSDVHDLRVGERVFGIARGSFAEYAVAKSRHLVTAPVELSDTEAAVLAESGLTALQALDSAGVRPGAHDRLRVLVIGASGGVGSLSVALATGYGAEVAGVCSAGKSQYVANLGATNVIDYQRQNALDGTARYDVILDAAGGHTLRALRGALNDRGTLVFVGNESGGRWTGGYGRPFAYQLRMLFRRQRFVNLMVETRTVDLERLAEHARSDALRPAIHAAFPLEKTREALDELVSGRAAGKIVVTITPRNQEHLA